MKYIYGLGKSGRSIVNYLKKNKEDFYCWDDDPIIRNKIKDNFGQITFIKPNKLDFKKNYESFISPGISLDDKNLEVLKKNKVHLFRDLELYSRVIKNIKIIAITGTNGKSTTTKLIGDLLKSKNFKNFVGGNIGVPLMNFKENKNNKQISYNVIELSSFQLESHATFDPYISILLNISKDHLNRYKNFKDYISQKEKIIKSNKEGINIICVDDAYSYEIYKKYKERTIPISKNFIKKGIGFKDGKIIDNYFIPNRISLINKISLNLYGDFNISNILAAYAVTRILKINFKDFNKVIRSFVGLPHRSELIYQNRFCQIINNSKATNLDAAIKSINNYQNIYLILGGKAKEKKFSQILNHKSKIKKIFLIGESAEIIFKQLSNDISCEICETLNLATKKIYLETKKLKKKFTILFAPACSSFDQFSNFEDRGNKFKRNIKLLFND